MMARGLDFDQGPSPRWGLPDLTHHFKRLPAATATAARVFNHKKRPFAVWDRKGENGAFVKVQGATATAARSATRALAPEPLWRPSPGDFRPFGRRICVCAPRCFFLSNRFPGDKMTDGSVTEEKTMVDRRNRNENPPRVLGDRPCRPRTECGKDAIWMHRFKTLLTESPKQPGARSGRVTRSAIANDQC